MKEQSKQLHIRLLSDIYKRLKVKCVHDDITMQDYVSQLITVSLDSLSIEENVGRNSKSRRKGK